MPRLHVSFALLAATGLCALVGCPADDPKTASLATFNVGLAFGYVSEASARVDPIIAALNASEHDVVCLQELWTDQDENREWTSTVIERVLGGTAQTYPHNYWVRTEVPDDAPEAGCEIEEADALVACAEPACGAEPAENLADCVLANCSEEFGGTSPNCQGCLVSNLGQELDTIVAACRGVTKGGIVYDGHNGLAILSKHPLSSTEILELDYALTARSVLHARTDLPGIGSTDVYCTHIASDLSGAISYPEGGTYGSFAEENAAQTQALLDWAEQTFGGGNIALMGDFNHGPARGGFEAELPESHQRVLAAGYDDPVATLEPPQCTFCAANLLQEGQGAGGEVIDHVYLKLASGEVQDAAIVFDEPVRVTSADGQPLDVNLSDHYGVAVTLRD